MLTRRTYGLMVLIALGVTVILTLFANPALAHVELVTSDPAHGSTVEVAPDLIELAFSTASEPVGDGVVLIGVDQQPIPAVVTQISPDTLVVAPDVQLDDGVFGVQWTMKAGDAHPRTGSITFRVDQQVASGADPGQGVAPSSDPMPDLGLADGPNTTVGDTLARTGRWLAIVGALVGIGAFAFAATSLVGSRREVLDAAFWVRRGGVLVIIGTIVEVIGLATAVASGSSSGFATALSGATSGGFGIAVLLRIVGGFAMVRGTSLRTRPAEAPAADATRLPMPSLGRGSTATITAQETTTERTLHRLDIHGDWLAIAGLVMVSIAFLFDGHTATAEPSFLVRASSLVHVVAAGVWVGGVIVMVQVLARRKRLGAALDAGPMAIRFSRVASVSLVAVALAGVALAWAILDSPGEIVTTSWGRLLILKLLAVGTAASMGAYNHLVVIPVLEAYGADADASERLRRVMRVEAVVLVGVVGITAVLVGAAS